MSTVLDIEKIEWIAVSEALPDDDRTVLVYTPKDEVTVWLGYYDEESEIWISVTGARYSDEDEIPEPVTAWATLPKGPQP